MTCVGAGVLDEATARLMRTPRCEVPDNVGFTIGQVPEPERRRRRREEGRAGRYVLEGRTP